MFELIDRRACKQRAAETLRAADVPAKAITAFYMALLIPLNLFDGMAGGGIAGSFISIFTGLLSSVLAAGFYLYCMAVRRGNRADYLTLFDGFSFAGKIILLNIVMTLFTALWSMLFVIPGIIAAYSYRFALFNLCENPGIGVMEALGMSKRQTSGYKSQLFMLDLSYVGWTILSMLPLLVVSIQAMAQYDDSFFNYYAAVPYAAAYLGIPSWLLTVLSGLWNLIVALFYFPHYCCVELDYFETAKSTSGIGKDPAPRNYDRDSWGSQGPDGLGGF